MITLWHNPRCSKSRAALGLLEERGVRVDVRRYLADTPSPEDLAGVIQKLGLPASALIRTNERMYQELGLDAVDSEEELLQTMCEHPILIERPIAIRANCAVIGRPPENVLSLL